MIVLFRSFPIRLTLKNSNPPLEIIRADSCCLLDVLKDARARTFCCGRFRACSQSILTASFCSWATLAAIWLSKSKPPPRAVRFLDFKPRHELVGLYQQAS